MMNFPSPETWLDGCFGLIIVDEETSTVRLVHFSLEEYLQRFRKDNELLFSLANGRFALACITYLLFDDLHRCRQDDTERFVLCKFHQYASDYWGDHTREMGHISRHHSVCAETDQACQLYQRLTDVAVRLLGNRPKLEVTLGYESRIRKRLRLGGIYEQKFTALHMVSYFGLTDIARRHFAGLDVEMRVGLYHKPLDIAAGEGHLEMVRFLLCERDADVEGCHLQVYTPLYKAVMGGHLDVVKLLAEHGAALEFKEAARSPLHFASRNGHLEVVKFLVENGALVNHDDISEGYESPLSVAWEHPEVVKYLVDHGAWLNPPEAGSYPPLFSAVLTGNVELVKLLLEKGARLQTTEPTSEETALHVASYQGKLNVVEFLIGEGANVNAKDKDGREPLYQTVFGANGVAIAECLINNGADLESKDIYGTTVLSHASSHPGLDLVKLLLKYGADTESKDKHERTPLFHALSWAGSLLAYKDIKEDKLELAARPARFLIEKSALIDSQDEKGQTPLIAESRFHALELVQFLVHHGASLAVKDKKGRSALSVAAKRSHMDVVNFLLFECGGDIADVISVWKKYPGSTLDRPKHVSIYMSLGSSTDHAHDRGFWKAFFPKFLAVMKRVCNGPGCKYIAYYAPTPAPVVKKLGRSTAGEYSVNNWGGSSPEALNVLFRLPARHAPTRFRTHAAALAFLREKNLPVPHPFAYDSGHENPLACSYVLQEAPRGAPLVTKYYKMTVDQKTQVVVAVVKLIARMEAISSSLCGEFMIEGTAESQGFVEPDRAVAGDIVMKGFSTVLADTDQVETRTQEQASSSIVETLEWLISTRIKFYAAQEKAEVGVKLDAESWGTANAEEKEDKNGDYNDHRKETVSAEGSAGHIQDSGVVAGIGDCDPAGVRAVSGDDDEPESQHNISVRPGGEMRGDDSVGGGDPSDDSAELSTSSGTYTPSHEADSLHADQYEDSEATRFEDEDPEGAWSDEDEHPESTRWYFEHKSARDLWRSLSKFSCEPMSSCYRRLLGILKRMKALGYLPEPRPIVLRNRALELDDVYVSIDEHGNVHLSDVIGWDELYFVPNFIARRPPMWLWNQRRPRYPMLGNTAPLTPDDQKLKGIFMEQIERALPGYCEDAFGTPGRLVRTLFRFALYGIKLEATGDMKPGYLQFIEDWKVHLQSLDIASQDDEIAGPNIVAEEIRD